MPHKAASAEASRKAVAPVVDGRMPTSRAPTRLTAVARSAFPVSVRSKNKNRSRLITAQLATMRMVWPDTTSGPSVKNARVIGSGRQPSGPANTGGGHDHAPGTGEAGD